MVTPDPRRGDGPGDPDVVPGRPAPTPQDTPDAPQPDAPQPDAPQLGGDEPERGDPPS